jgi:hypothetical protein
MKKLLFFCLSLFLSLSIFAQEQVVRLEGINLETSVPETWKILEENGSIEVSSPNGDIMISFQSFPESELEAVLAGLDQMMKETITDLKPVSESDVIEINGLQVMMSDAHGNMDGVPVQLAIFLVPSDSMVLLILGIARSDSKEEDIQGLETVIGELKKS